MRMNGLLLCGSLIFLIGCSNLKKETAATSPAAAPATAPAAAATASSPAAGPAKAATPATTTAGSPKESLTCKRGSEVRTLEIETLQPKGCKLWYSRYGNRNSVASSEKANTHCESVQDRIQKNLETVQFACTVGAISQDNSAPAVKAPVAPTASTAPAVKAPVAPTASTAPAAPVAKKEVAPVAPKAAAAASAAAPVPSAPATNVSSETKKK